MTTDDSKEDITAMAATEMSTATTYPQFDPLDINCELALSFIVDYIRSENFPSGIQLPDLTTLPNSIFLDKIAEMLLIPALTECISIAFYPILPVIVGRWAMSGDQVERIACAFGRILFLEPKLKRYAQEFLFSSPSFLQGIAHLTPQSQPDELATQFSEFNVDELREILLAAFRLVLFSRSNFLRFLSPTPLLTLLKHPDRTIRYLALELLCLTVGIADAAKAEWTTEYLGGPEDEIMGLWENVTIDYGVMPVLESQRLYNAKKVIQERDYFQQSHGRKLAVSDLGGWTGEICGVLIPRFDGTVVTSTTLVMTENTKRNLREMATRIVAEEPLLLESVSGSGKSFLIDEIAKLFGRYEDIVRITLTDQTDAKILLGTYVTSTPGSFTWCAGILTTAVKEGKWIVIEDIERAGNDVLSVLLPLLEGRPLELNGRGQVEMGKGGQLIVTTRLLSGAKSAQVENMLGIQRWSRVAIIPPTDDDLLEIINNLLPRLKFLAPVLLRVYSTLRELSDNPMLKLSRRLSPRDLLKWTKRTSSLCSKVDGETIPREIWDDIFLEAVDCFAAMIPSTSARNAIVEKIGTEMGFPMERINLYIESHAPNLRDDARILHVGRISIPKNPGTSRRNQRPFAYTNHARKLIEQLAVAVLHREPLLLVGETGTGKTTIVQHLADMLHHRLVVVNVSQQTESSDLLGGFKPVDPRTVAIQIKESFERLFERTFSMRRNELFISRVNKYYSSQKWSEFVKLLKESVSKAVQRFQTPPPDDGTAKKKRRVEGDLKEQWAKFSDEIASFELQLTTGKGKGHAFSFVEGSLVKALKRGDWILLDEVNLAAADTLESISGLIREGGSVTLPEKADLEPIKPHPDFRIFTCMNPATDVGKRDLPAALRGQFTELYVGSPDESMADLLLIIKQYIGHLCVGDERAVSDVAQLYLNVKSAAERHDIVDGVGQKPHFSIRTLTRTLTYVADTSSMYGLRRALYEGFCMSFSTMLERGSRETVMQAISDALYPAGNKNLRAALRSLPKRPDGDSIQLGHYWIERGDQVPQENPLYIVKENTSVERNLHNLVRASLTRRYPILLQGPTSSGKTSMIEHLAKLTGHKFLRINNHEHTSLDEYLGTYISAPTGEFVFQEGILIEALRKGHWIVLDELNLAPSDVLEALNRLLDDNRELLVPETQEIIIPHPHFMLFATQNPAGLYGGRKVLSRAFRNRFLELEFDDIPEDELEEILCLRCEIPPSYGARIVEVYKQLSLQRQSTRLFEQRNSFATLRDLFRWAQREAVGYQQLAENGYMLLAERVRKVEERLVVKQVIEKVMKVKIDDNSLYDVMNLSQSWMTSNLIWTKSMRRLFILVHRALVNNEPVLLVGETGSGKTTVCQVLAETMGTKLHIINAHQNTETGDIIGSQRPFRDRLMYQSRLVEELRKFFSHRPESTDMALDDLAEEFSKLDVEQLLAASANPDDISAKIDLIRDNFGRQRTLFEWVDGALVQAMKQGEFFLLDEISLAEDSVLERLNSVLESSRNIVLAEKGGDDVHVTAADGFQFLATMNPGGDYGKKELSPALRNRFTEIWVPAVEDRDDLIQIIQASLVAQTEAACLMVDFAEWFTKRTGSMGTTISIRDMLAWVQFINATYVTLSLNLSLFHGAMMVYVDGIGTTSGTEFVDVAKEKSLCINYLSNLLRQDLSVEYTMPVKVVLSTDSFMLGHFAIPRGTEIEQHVPFSFGAPTTAANGMKVIRAMQLPKSILLEGAPGIGKTSLITAIAAAAGHNLTRINLSDQTDLMDLFGSDVPVEGGRGGEFAWRDAPFLRAMQNGGWVLLDELNLASQSVLEGLNACLDHRGSAYIPELNRSFARHQQFRIFAAQNPHSQGGGRKGLPKSFINRFSVVHVESLTQEDMCTIGSQVFPVIPAETVSTLISFVMTVQDEAQSSSPFGSLGRPWEFNLRDVLRWLELLRGQDGLLKDKSAADYLHLVISQRLRTKNDRQHLAELFEQKVGPLNDHPIVYSLGLATFQAGMVVTGRRKVAVAPKQIEAAISVQQSRTMEVLSLCIEKAWPCILVGPSGSGKTSMIRAMASITGAALQEFSMNSDTDATDILGGYEQRDPYRQLSCVTPDLRNRICELLALAPGSMEHSVYGKVIELCSLVPSSSAEASSLLTAFNEVLNELGSQTQQIFDLVDNVKKLLLEIATEQESGKFQWYDGMLIDALTKGSWIILENANLCNPSVLDRLNSLLEPNGFLVLHECTDASGAPRIIVPHQNFRLFITMDPRYGELSRAMRNRAVEVAVHYRPDRMMSSGFPLQMYSDVHPLLRFLQQAFTLFCEKPESWPVESQIKCAGQLLEYVPIQSLPYLKRWLNSNFPPQFAQAAFQMGLTLELLMELPVTNDLISYTHIASSDIGLTRLFADSQVLLPSLNDFLPSSVAPPELKSSEVNAELLSLTYDLCVTFSNIRRKMHYLQQEALKADRSETRQLVLASKKSEKGISTSLQPAVSTLSLLNNISDQLKNWLVARTYIQSDIQDLTNLNELLRLWLEMVQILNEENLDPSYYIAFRNLLESWIERVNGSILSGFVTQVRSQLKALSNSVALSTGISMPLIWNIARPNVPSNLEQWEAYDKLTTFLKNFESNVTFQDQKLDAIISIKSAFVDALCALLSSQSSDLPTQSFEIAESVLNTSATPAGNDIFTDGFRGLHNILQIQMDGSLDSERTLLLRLSHLSGNSTLQSLNSFIAGGTSAFESIFRVLPENESTALQTFCCDIVLYTTSNLDFDAVLRKLRNFGKLFSQTADYSIWSDAGALLSLMEEDIKELLQIHMDSDSISQAARSAFSSLFSLLERRVDADAVEETDSVSSDLPLYVHYPIQEIRRAISAIISGTEMTDDSSERFAFVAATWVRFSLACIALYVPDKPNDPAAAAILDLKRHNLQEADLMAAFQSRLFIEERLRGPDGSSRLKYAAERLKQANIESQGLLKSEVYRPKISQVSQIQQDLNQLLEITIKSNRFDAFLKEPGSRISELRTVIENLKRLATKLEVNYPFYRDSLAFIIGTLSTLIFGLTLLLEIESHKSVQASRVQIPAQPFLSVARITISPTVQSWSSYRESISSFEGSITTFNLCMLERVCLALTIKSTSASPTAIIRTILDDCYVQWRIAKERKKAEEAAKTSIYKRKDEEYELEQAIAEYFPDQELEDDVLENISQAEDEETAARIYALHRTLFRSPNDDITPVTIVDVLNRGLKLVAKCSDAFSSHHLMLDSFPAHLLSLASARQYLVDVDSASYDFYRSPNFLENRQFMGLLSDVHRKTTTFLEDWPDHANLHDISLLYDRVMSLPASVPLSRLLSYVERLYSLMDQWQDVASRDYSLAEYYEKVKDTIVRWRRLELGCWKTLLVAEARRHQEGVASWWFDIYENVIYNLRADSMTDFPEHLTKVIASLDGFMSAGTLGDYDERLRLLGSFALHAHSESEDHPALDHIYRSCSHMYRIYALYSPETQRSMEQQKIALEKEVSETVQLASWRDTSVFALTESAKRSHRRLYKTVRKYRDLLSEPITPILRRGVIADFQSAAVTSEAAYVPFISEVDQETIAWAARFCERENIWSTNSRILLDPGKLSISIQNIFHRFHASPSDVAITVDDFIETVENLRKQTPSLLTDENEKQVKFLKTQKRRIFAQTMKSLREWGITSKAANPNVNDASRMSLTPVRSGYGTDNRHSRIDYHFYNILELLPRVREAGLDHSPDLSDDEFHRAHGYIEALIDGMFDQRSLVCDFEDRVSSLKTASAQTIILLVDQVKSIDDIKWIVSPSAGQYMASRIHVLQRLTAVVETCISVLSAQREIDEKARVQPLSTFLKNLLEDSQTWLARLDRVSWNDNIIFPDAVSATLRVDDFELTEGTDNWVGTDSLDNWLFMTSTMIIDLVSLNYPELLYSIQPILNVLESTDQWEKLSPTQFTDTIPDVTRFQQAAESLGSTTLVATQELSKLLTQVETATSINYPQMKRLQREITKLLSPSTVKNRVMSMYEEAIPLLSSQRGLQHVFAVFNSLLPILEQYINGCQLVQYNLEKYHEGYSQMTHVLLLAFHTLVTKGYCSPQREDKSSGPTEGQGVGLGEGEGQTDISNDIKDDEDLNDLAKQEKGQSNESNDVADQEDGVEMDDDFDGALEDAPQGEDEEEGSDGEDDMDEGTGAVDDADPSAVDEQFWEDQGNQQPESADEKQTQGKKELEEEGELGASSNDKEKQKQKEAKEETKAPENEESAEEAEGSEIDESGLQNREDETLMPEAQPLDIAEDLDLTQPDGEAKAESIFSDDEMDLDDQADDDQHVPDESVSDNDLEELRDEENMQVEGEEQPDGEEMVEEDNVNTHNVDQSEYVGEDTAQSAAFGNGGDSAATEEKHEGAQGEDSMQDTPDSPNQISSNPMEGATGQGNDHLESTDLRKESTDEQNQSEATKDNPFRKLGDMLEQWRRDLQSIQDIASEEHQEEKTVGEQNPEFSYVGEDEQFDTQGLGPAAPDQVQPLDMSMAIEDEEPSNGREAKSREEIRDETPAQGMEVDSTSHPTSFGASIGDRSKDPDRMDFDQAPPATIDEAPQSMLDTVETRDTMTISSAVTENAREIWQQHDRATHDLSLSLCEQLRLILEPTLATKMRGDFRTGKRLNMRRIIPYIASDYKKDKIWMRRTKPSKRQYQIMIAIDDSKSMSDSKSVKLAFDTLALTAKALSQLEVGQIGIVRFGEDVKVVHGFEEQFTSESGGKVVQQFQFDQSRTDVCALTRSSIKLFNIARAQQDIRSSVGTELWQLQLIISDGICEDHDTIRRMVREAFEAKIMMIFVILDAIHPERKDSILDIKSYSFESGETGQTLRETRYLDSFPFNYFVIVRDVAELPSVLASALRQWFAEVAEL